VVWTLHIPIFHLAALAGITSIGVRRGYGGALLVMLLTSATGSADTFSVAEAEGLYNVTLSYGALFRLDNKDEDLIAFVNGGNLPSANTDDGDLNYNKGLVSSVARASGELALAYGDFGVYIRGAAFYDFQTQGSGPQRTDFGGAAKKLVGSDAQIREGYLNWSLAPGGMPMVVRVGRQILNWSETSFVRDGLDTINPADLVTSFTPAGSVEDFRVPQGMLWVAANITETFSLEAYYQYQWEPVTLPPVGWYFSNNDAVGGEGMGNWMFGAGSVSDQGTDLDQRFELPAGTLGFDEEFQRLNGFNRDKPEDGGQYGAALIGVLPGRNALKLGFHYMRYHSRLPLLMSRTADAQAVSATAEPFVSARATQLEQVYLDEGLEPGEAQLLGRAAAESLTLSDYANEASLFVTYPEDIDLIGFSFTTSVPLIGSLLAGEVSHHFDYPFQIVPGAVTQAVFSPVLFDTPAGDTVLGDFGPDAVVTGYQRLDRTQASFQLARIFRGLFTADRVVVSADVAWVKVHDLPNIGEPQLTSRDSDSWGYRLAGSADYLGLFGGVNLQPYAIFSHDVSGTTPGPLSTFVEDRKALAVGLGGSYLNRLEVDVRFTSFFGGGRRNLLRDRDVLRFQVSYSL
jgi:hypothetical protein